MCESQHLFGRSKSRPFSLPVGRVVLTPGAVAQLVNSGDKPAAFLDRHISGDWGEVPAAVRQLNDTGAAFGGLVFSSYRMSTGVSLWIITEVDRSVTTMLLPEEY